MAERKRTADRGSGLAGGEPPGGGELLRVTDLCVELETREGWARPLRGVDLEIRAGETVGLIGESGSGKTLTALSILRLLPARHAIGGRIGWRGRDVLSLPERRVRGLRGREIGMIFQDPLSSLHPWYRVVDQVAEALRAHTDLSRREARRRSLGLLERVGISAAHAERHPFPHQWSGGMRQRAVVAMAIANGPRLLIADEPTTALDVTVQAQILELLREALRDTGAAALLISHDLAVVAQLAERVAVMDGGRVIEFRPIRELFANPEREKTRELLAAADLLGPSNGTARPKPGAEGGSRITASPPSGPSAPAALNPPTGPHRAPGTDGAATEPVLRVVDLIVEHRGDGPRARSATVRAVDGVSFELRRGETMGLVGESGCGKSTLARALLALDRPVAGHVYLDGEDLLSADRRRLRRLRARIQMVFQDPLASLNPRRTVAETVAAPLRAHGRFRAAGGEARVRRLLELVRLEPELAGRYPHQLSGGQRQRVGIARALALDPEVLVLDEPVTALDAAVRARVLGLLRDLQAELGISMLLIAHDLAVVRSVAHRVAVMYLGRLVEVGEAQRVFSHPAHPYTVALLSAIPSPHPATEDDGSGP